MISPTCIIIRVIKILNLWSVVVLCTYVPMLSPTPSTGLGGGITRGFDAKFCSEGGAFVLYTARDISMVPA